MSAREWWQVVKPAHCCGDGRAVGHLIQIWSEYSGDVRCAMCGRVDRNVRGWVSILASVEGGVIEKSRLQKLPDITEDATQSVTCSAPVPAKV